MSVPLDCSDDAQDLRRELLKGLMLKLYSGVDSLSDRGRSVNYLGPDDLQQLIKNLGNEIAKCEGSYQPASRVFTWDYNKWA
jgi:hypothetical protein